MRQTDDMPPILIFIVYFGSVRKVKYKCKEGTCSELFACTAALIYNGNASAFEKT